MIKKHYYRALIRFDKKQKKNRQIEKTRQVEKTRQIEKARQIKTARFIEQNLIKEFAKQQQIEKTRLVNERAKQQKIEQIRIAKKQKKIRLTTFACKRCNAKFSNNTKFHQHVQNHHQKKLIKFANEFAIITSNEFAIITSIATFASITFFFTSKTMITMFTFFATFSLSNESKLLFTLFVNHSKSISKFSFSDTSFVTSIATSIATSRKSIF